MRPPALARFRRYGLPRYAPESPRKACRRCRRLPIPQASGPRSASPLSPHRLLPPGEAIDDFRQDGLDVVPVAPFRVVTLKPAHVGDPPDVVACPILVGI